ncbi:MULTISPECIES: hypothetical protein [Streptomyces]
MVFEPSDQARLDAFGAGFGQALAACCGDDGCAEAQWSGTSAIQERAGQ